MWSQFEIHLMHWNLRFKKEVMLLYGIGFRDLLLASFTEGKKVSAYIIDETVIQIGNRQYWLWMCIEPIHSSVLGIYISEERNMFIDEKFIRSLIDKYGKHKVTQMVIHGILKPVHF